MIGDGRYTYYLWNDGFYRFDCIQSTPIGANMQQADFGPMQGRAEVRICIAGGVPPTVVGVSESNADTRHAVYVEAEDWPAAIVAARAAIGEDFVLAGVFLGRLFALDEQ